MPSTLGRIQKLSGNVGHLVGSHGSVWDQLDLGEQLQSRKKMSKSSAWNKLKVGNNSEVCWEHSEKSKEASTGLPYIQVHSP